MHFHCLGLVLTTASVRIATDPVRLLEKLKRTGKIALSENLFCLLPQSVFSIFFLLSVCYRVLVFAMQVFAKFLCRFNKHVLVTEWMKKRKIKEQETTNNPT